MNETTLVERDLSQVERWFDEIKEVERYRRDVIFITSRRPTWVAPRLSDRA